MDLPSNNPYTCSAAIAFGEAVAGRATGVNLTFSINIPSGLHAGDLLVWKSSVTWNPLVICLEPLATP